MAAPRGPGWAGRARVLLVVGGSLLLLRLAVVEPGGGIPALVHPPPARSEASARAGAPTPGAPSGIRHTAQATPARPETPAAAPALRWAAGGPEQPASGGAAAGDSHPPAHWTNRDGPAGAHGLDARDLRVLAELAAANGLGEGSSDLDYDDGNGVLEPQEVGLQVWRGGRLVSLSMGEDRYGSFGYALEKLPPSLGDLDALEALDLHSNRITTLPDSLGNLARLRVLRLQRNALTALPDSIGGLARLEELSLGENALAQLPPGVGALAALEELHVNDNPLLRLPDQVGSLARLRVLNVSHDGAVDPVRAAAATSATVPPAELPGGRLTELPPGIAALERLETLHLAGNQLFCAGGVPDPGLAPPRLRDGSIPRLHGLTAQSCGTRTSP